MFKNQYDVRHLVKYSLVLLKYKHLSNLVTVACFLKHHVFFNAMYRFLMEKAYTCIGLQTLNWENITAERQGVRKYHNTQ